MKASAGSAPEALAASSGKMADLALILDHQGRHGEAESLTEECLRIRQEALGDFHPDTLESMHQLAAYKYRPDQINEASELAERCFQCRQKPLGPDDPDTLLVMYHLAYCR